MFLRRKQGGDENKGLPVWIVSYGDLVTTLLCFFIILSVLAKDQTGMRLYEGLESFRNRPVLPKLAGSTKRTTQMYSKAFPGPDTVPEALLRNREEGHGGGLDDESTNVRVIDLEQEEFQRFLSEMDRRFDLTKPAAVMGRSTLDVYEAVDEKNPRLSAKTREVVGQALALIERPGYRMTIAAWATTPSRSAWLRAGRLSSVLMRSVITELAPSADARGRLTAQGRAWRYPDRKRPVFSLIIEQIKTAE